MAKEVEKLTPEFVAEVVKPGFYADGLGLYLQVSIWSTKSWVLRYTRHRKAHTLGLGPVHTVSLAEARRRARKARQALLDGIDPIAAKRERARQAKLEQSRALTFEEAAEAYIKAHAAGWKNAKHAEQWHSTLATYAYPVIGKQHVRDIDTALVVRVLEPIWTEKTETASRLRGRIEAILAWATVRGYREGDNPARWRNHLDKLLAPRNRVQRTEHHAALPYREIGAFMEHLREQHGIAALALQFCILTACRTSEVIRATWEEIDLEGAVWTIPADRMKAGKEHRIPLSAPALAILRELQPLDGEFVFKGLRADRPLSNMAMLKLLQRMGRGDLTVHGFRSTFRDWAGETTAHPREVIEHALAHQLKDKAEAAYQRGTLFDKRRRLMDDWARYCETPQAQGEVVPIRGAA